MNRMSLGIILSGGGGLVNGYSEPSCGSKAINVEVYVLASCCVSFDSAILKQFANYLRAT